VLLAALRASAASLLVAAAGLGLAAAGGSAEAGGLAETSGSAETSGPAAAKGRAVANGPAAAGSTAVPAPAALVALGRRLYRTGAGGGPQITAVIGGENGTEVSATELPCAGCHGRDGRGRPEGGVAPSELTWEVLTRPYGVTHTGGRHAPAYDEHTLKRAITLGIDAGGTPLQTAMPHYRLTQEQAAALVAYLRVLGHETDPGVDADRLRLGVLLPPGPEGSVVRGDLDAFAAAVNGGGGLFGRRLDLRYLVRQPGGPAGGGSERAAVERFVTEEQVFALVASSVAGAEGELADFAADEELPVVGALTADPRGGGQHLNRWVFYLQSGLAEQARALVDAVASGLGGQSHRPGLLVPVPATTGGMGGTAGGGPAAGDATPGAEDAAAAAALAQYRHDGLEPWAASYHPGAGELAERAAAANRAGVDALVFLGDSAAARELLTAAARLGWRPRVFLLAVRAGGALAGADRAAFGGALYLAAPALPSDVTAKGLDLLRLNAAPRPSPHATAYERAALAAMAVLREALTRCGREVSRDGLIAALESLHLFDTGLTPPLTFDPNRRIGALGAYIVTYDPRQPDLAPGGGWVTPR
jgi:ABC-type branched-subunit amino acid transport system substrate-binding protein